MIDQVTIDRIMDAANIVEVVSEFVTLRKRGVNYIGLCPFHNEKTPSFSVSPAKRLCKCFSCGKGGNVVHFLMEHEQLSYYEALKWLAKKYNIEIHERELTEEEKQYQSTRESLFVINEFAQKYFQNLLMNTADGQTIGMAYFRQRGFRDDIIKKFQLGICNRSWDAFAKEALQKGYKREFLLKTGLCYEKEDHSLVDRFHGRVIFPVQTLSGKIVAFGGRVLVTDKKLAKYVNSPESEIYHKSNELYGIYLAKQMMVKDDKCFLVEGYTDVISMHQSGIENVVASSGTALTFGQIRLIHRFTNNITVLYDGDMAGIHASIRGIDMLLEEGMNIKVVLLPDGDDPDSFARKHNATEYQTYIEQHEQDFIRFKTNLMLTEAGKDPIKRAELITDIVKSISVIPEPIVRSVYIRETSQMMHVEEKMLQMEVGKIIEKKMEKGSQTSYNPTTEVTTKAQESADNQGNTTSPLPLSFIPTNEGEDQPFFKNELLIIKILIRYGERVMCEIQNDQEETIPLTVIEYIIQDLNRDKLELHSPLHQQILKEAMQHLHDENFESEKYFVNHTDIKISTLASELSSDRYVLSNVFSRGGLTIIKDEERLYELVPRILSDFKIAKIEAELQYVQRKLQDPDYLTDDKKLKEALARLKQLQETRNIMAHQVGDRVIIPQ